MQDLELVNKKIKEYVNQIGHEKSVRLFELLSNGKMLRSKLILKIAGLSDDSIKLCAIIEMIQTASLLHDDVIDDANTRRGQASINALFDNKTAIMFGDILYSKAFTLLTSMPQEIAFSVSNSVTSLSVGEMLDVDLGNEFNTSYEKYIDMIYKKTSSLIESSAYCAALLANKNKESYALYGKNLGIAFQMVDDILDITSNSKTLGKPVMHDFYEGKVTIPYLYLYKRLDNNDKKTLKDLYKKSLSQEQIIWIKDKLQDTNSLQDAINLANTYGQEAIKVIQNENNDDLVDIMNSMINRSF